MRRRKELSDKLDTALDGRLVEADEDLAPLVETAAELRAALADVELAPEAAERHLGMVLGGEAEVVALPTRPGPPVSQWQRRVAAVALAAALTVLPATMASASALPGQALYPVKLAVEQLRVTAVMWSNTRKATEQIKIADNRLDELNRLIQLNAADRIPSAILRLNQAVEEAVRDTGDAGQARALDRELAAVTAGSTVALQRLRDKVDQAIFPASARQAITDAIRQAPVTPDPVEGTGQPTPTTDGPSVTTSTGSPTTTQASTTTQAPTIIQPPTTTQGSTTTQAPTTQGPTTSQAPDASTSPDQVGNNDGGQGSSGETATTLP